MVCNFLVFIPPIIIEVNADDVLMQNEVILVLLLQNEGFVICEIKKYVLID